MAARHLPEHHQLSSAIVPSFWCVKGWTGVFWKCALVCGAGPVHPAVHMQRVLWRPGNIVNWACGCCLSASKAAAWVCDAAGGGGSRGRRAGRRPTKTRGFAGGAPLAARRHWKQRWEAVAGGSASATLLRPLSASAAVPAWRRRGLPTRAFVEHHHNCRGLGKARGINTGESGSARQRPPSPEP